MQVFDDVCENIEADEIERAKRRGLRPTGGGPGDLVYLFDRVAIVQHRAHGYQRAISADAIRNEVRPILRDDHAFAQALIEKAKHRA